MGFWPIRARAGSYPFNIYSRRRWWIVVDICRAANRWYILNYESIYCVYLESARHICNVWRQKSIKIWLELAEDVFVSIFFWRICWILLKAYWAIDSEPIRARGIIVKYSSTGESCLLKVASFQRIHSNSVLFVRGNNN